MRDFISLFRELAVGQLLLIQRDNEITNPHASRLAKGSILLNLRYL